MKKFLLFAMAFVAFAATAEIESMKARLPTIIDMKSKGLVGEQPDGYLGVIKNEGGAQAVANAENSDRKAEYTKRAAAQGQTVEVLAGVLGEARVRQEKSGRFVRQKDGSWVKN